MKSLSERSLDIYYDIFEESPLPIIVVEEMNPFLLLNTSARTLLCDQGMISEIIPDKAKRTFHLLFQKLLTSQKRENSFFETLNITGNKIVLAEVMGKLLYDPQTDKHRGMFILITLEKPTENYLVTLGFDKNKLPMTFTRQNLPDRP